MLTNKLKIDWPSVGALLILIALISSIFLVSKSKNAKAKENQFHNIELRIVSINYDCSLTNDKFHKPQLCNAILFETITGPHLYCEINTCTERSPGIRITTKWLYNHRPGDIVHFDYLSKNRFFEIKPR